MNNYDLSDLGGTPITEGKTPPSIDLSDLGGIPSQPQERTWGQTGAILGKGLVSGALGAIPDLTAAAYNVPASLFNAQQQAFQQGGYDPRVVNMMSGMTGVEMMPEGLFQELPQIPSATEAIESGFDTATGGYTQTPEELRHLYEGTKFAGSLAGFGGFAKGAGQLGYKGLQKAGKLLGASTPAELAGGLGAGTVMSAAEEDLGPLGALGAGALTGTLTHKGAGKIEHGLKALQKDIKEGRSLGEMSIGRALALRGEPSNSIIKIAEKEGIKLPFFIKLRSDISNFLANSVLRSVFTSKQYKDSLKETDQAMIDSVKKRINDISPELIGKEGVSQIYREGLKQEESAMNEEAHSLYDSARSYLKPEDKIIPSHTINVMKELKSDLSAPVPSDSMKFVTNRVGKLAEAFGLSSKALKNIEEESPQLYEKIMETLSQKASPVSLDSLIQQKQAFMQDMRYGDVKGTKKLLGRLVEALDKDISSSKNTKFIENWRVANDFYKNEVVNKIRTDFAESLLKGEMPKEAYSYMNSPREIRELKRILGDHTSVNQIMNSLKRAKLQEVLVERVINSDGQMSYANFANMFTKKNNQQELLKELLGKKSYNDLKDISQIAQEFVVSGKTLANPSGTATTAKDFDRIGGVVSAALGFGAGGPQGALLGASGYAAVPWIVSKIVSNPKYMNAAVKYAQNAKNGNMSGILTEQKKMKRIFLEMIAKESPTFLNRETHKRKESSKSANPS